MLRPHDLWTIAHDHDPGRPADPHRSLELGASPRATVLGGRRRLAAAVVPALALLAACGSGDPARSAYCAAVEDAKPSFVALQSGDPEKFEQAFDDLHGLAKDSPADLDADWQLLDRAVRGVQTALGTAGIDFTAVAAGDLPQGTDPKKLEAVMVELEALASPEVEEAANNIEHHAFEECDVELAAG